MNTVARAAAPMVCAALLALTPAAAHAQQAPKKYALLVGLNRYLYAGSVPQLTYARSDVEALADLFTKQGYEVHQIPDDRAEHDRVVGELYWFANQLTEADTFVLYYAGHGMRNRINGKTYWLTYDATPSLLDGRGIRLEHLLDYVRDIRARTKLILLDHCFAADVVGALGPRNEAPASPTPGPSPPPGTPPPARGPDSADTDPGIRFARNAVPVGDDFQRQMRLEVAGTVILAAARGFAYEVEELKHGVFTQALLDACTTPAGDTDRDRKLSATELMAFMKKRVAELALQKAGAKQDMLDYSFGSLAGWNVCDLPVNDMEARQKSDAYKLKLNEWAQKDWITNESKLTCFGVLIAWVDARGDEARLSQRDQQILVQIRTAVDGPGPERVKADALNVYLRGLGS